MIDEYGERNGWIEIYNNTAKTQIPGGMYLTTDRTILKCIRFPWRRENPTKALSTRFILGRRQTFHGIFIPTSN